MTSRQQPQTISETQVQSEMSQLTSANVIRAYSRKTLTPTSGKKNEVIPLVFCTATGASLDPTKAPSPDKHDPGKSVIIASSSTYAPYPNLHLETSQVRVQPSLSHGETHIGTHAPIR